MNKTIRLLSEDIIGKIAAGEVVERPSAAIKEMVENSLDAGATAVTVEIRDGGITYFRVTDNGSGIAQRDIRLAFERHATSKIENAKDLYAIQTLGFRGEALASIAAVAKVTCTTRTREDISGIKVVNQGGQILSIEEAACPEGTTFAVRDLFYNTPVRLKFLKKPATEASYVSDLMMRLILSRPDVSFRYISQGKTLYHSAGDGKLSSAVFSIYGKEMKTFREIDGHQCGVIVKGFVGVGNNTRASRGHQSFFINGRYMKSGLLTSAVEAACRERVPVGRYPACVLHLTMPFDMVDVNVHPNKLECRFQNEADLSLAIEQIIRDAMVESNPLEASQPIKLTADVQQESAAVQVRKQETVAAASTKPMVMKPEAAVSVKKSVPELPTPAAETRRMETPAKETPATMNTSSAPAAAEKPSVQVTQPRVSMGTPLQARQPVKPAVLHEPPAAVQAFMQSYRQLPPAYDTAKGPQTNAQKTVEQQKMDSPISFLPELPKPLRLIGSVFNSYILMEYDSNLLLVDQQGVHERLLFDRMMKAFDQKACGQELLIPIIIPATRREQQLLEMHQEMLQGIGLFVEPFGETEVAIRSIPMILGQPQAGDLLHEVLEQLEGERGVISMERRRAGIMALACKKAVRAGEKLKEEDIRELVVRMVENKVTPTSPRGTPLIVALSKSELDRRFRRPQ